MKIENETTFSFEGNTLRSMIVQSLKPCDVIAQEFMRMYRERGYEEVLVEHCTGGKDAVRMIIATGVVEGGDTRNNEWTKQGWQMASLAHWYHYQNEVALHGETLVIGGDVYRDENFTEWVPIIHHQKNIFGDVTHELVMKTHASCFPLKNNMKLLLVKLEHVKK